MNSIVMNLIWYRQIVGKGDWRGSSCCKCVRVHVSKKLCLYVLMILIGRHVLCLRAALVSVLFVDDCLLHEYSNYSMPRLIEASVKWLAILQPVCFVA
jgi:hypothetical protein